MPKSKRDKKISLTRVEKKNGLDTKQKLMERIRDSVDNYARIFVFKVENMRNNKLKDVREKWYHSKFFIGKNRVIAKALGNSPEEEYNDNLHMISRLLRGECGLLFTNQSKEDVIQFFENLAVPDYARTGGTAIETVVLPEGPLPEFSHAIEPQLRQLGMPTTLKKGVVTLIQEFTVCKKGDTLTSEQARILKLLGKEQAEFKLRMVASWTKDGDFETHIDLPLDGPQLSGNMDAEDDIEEDDELSDDDQ